MNWKDIAKTIATGAPLLGTALGGPAGGAIGAMVASALGVDPKPDAVADALKNDPGAMLKLQELQFNNEADLRNHAFKIADAEIKDVQNAREVHKLSKMPAYICCALTVMVGFLAYLIFFTEIPAANKEMAYIIFGVISAKWGDSIAFWIGTTRSSAEKNSMFRAK